MLVLVYVASAAAGGSFLAKLMQGSMLAYLISVAIQATRAVIVFFPQMNPMRPAFGITGEAAAVVFGLLSIYEMYELTEGAELPTAVFVSVAVLMAAGIIIEIMMLKEVKYSTEVELITDTNALDRINKHMQGVASIKAQLEAMREAAANGTYVLPTPTPSTSTPDTTLIDRLAELEKAIQEKDEQLHALALFVGPTTPPSGPTIPNGHPLGKTSGTTV